MEYIGLAKGMVGLGVFFVPNHDFLSFTGVGVVDFFERGRGMIVLDIYCE